MQTGDNAPMPQRIGVPREVYPGEKRVATVPDAVTKLVKLGFAVVVEQGAGELADLSDEAFVQAGATIAPNAAALWSGSDIVFKVRAPTSDEVALMHEGQTLIGFLWPAQNPDLMQQLAAKKVTALSIDALPRTLSRAQKMDALTSMAGVSGYRAVVEAANAFGRFFNGQITAAGKVPPAKVFIAGAGWPVWPRSARPPAWAPLFAPTTPAPKWPTRSSRLAVSSSRWTTRRRARAAAGTPRS